MRWPARSSKQERKQAKNGARARRSASLEPYVRASRAASGEETLSADARESILREALRGGPADEPLAPLFMPVRRLMVAGALPVVLAAVLVVGLQGSLQSPPSGADATPAVAAVKQGDRVLFNISNGGRPHVVYRSTQPDSFEGASGVAVSDGTFEDGLHDQADLVFYRID